jgi:hypothetical protein
MKEIHADLQTLKPYLYVVAGVLLGIALCMLLGKLGYLNFSNNKAGKSQQDVATLPGGQTEVKDFLKDVDPTKPYTDPNGVTHPALYSGEGTYVPPQALTPEQLKEVIRNAPPAGAPAPVPPTPPAVPKAAPSPNITPVTATTTR